MLKARVIPVVLLRNGRIVQSRGFSRFQILGNPTAIVQRLSEWAADELIYLDISRPGPPPPAGTSILPNSPNSPILEILREVARSSFMPLAFGGGIRSLADIEARILAGADKVVINSQAFHGPRLIREAAREFGSQAVIVSIDARASTPDSWSTFVDGARTPTHQSPAISAHIAQDHGAGEIFLNSIDRDGSGLGYDLPLIRSVVDAVQIPVIACGGVGSWEHLAQGLVEGGAAAVAAANIFHHSENSVLRARQFLHARGLPVRPPVGFPHLTPIPSIPTDLPVEAFFSP